MQSTAAKMVGS